MNLDTRDDHLTYVPFVGAVTDPAIERIRAENERTRHEECVVAWEAREVVRLAVKINDWLVEHPGWWVKHQSLASVPETKDTNQVYAVLVTMEKGVK